MFFDAQSRVNCSIPKGVCETILSPLWRVGCCQLTMGREFQWAEPGGSGGQQTNTYPSFWGFPSPLSSPHLLTITSSTYPLKICVGKGGVRGDEKKAWRLTIPMVSLTHTQAKTKKQNKTHLFLATSSGIQSRNISYPIQSPFNLLFTIFISFCVLFCTPPGEGLVVIPPFINHISHTPIHLILLNK